MSEKSASQHDAFLVITLAVIITILYFVGTRILAH